MKKDFISIHDLGRYEFNEIMDLTEKIKRSPSDFRKALKGKVLTMIFQKPSLRTRMTFEVGMLQLGGHAVYLSPGDGQVGVRESFYDVGKNLERWVDGIMIRTFAHKNILDLAAAVKVPVINALSDRLHPCQAMADFFTLKEKAGDLARAEAGLRRRREQRLPQPDVRRRQGRKPDGGGHAPGLRTRRGDRQPGARGRPGDRVRARSDPTIPGMPLPAPTPSTPTSGPRWARRPRKRRGRRSSPPSR